MPWSPIGSEAMSPHGSTRPLRRASGGTPLLIHELLDDLVERGVLVQRAEVWELRGDELPVTRSATDLIRSRLDRVEVHDRAVLEALAVVNGPTDPHVVAALLNMDLDSVEASLDRLRSIRLAIETDRERPLQSESSWTVEHPVIAEVVEAELVDAARRRLHRRLLDVDSDAPLGRRARHALIAGEPTDRLATITLLADAGSEALAPGDPLGRRRAVARSAVVAARERRPDAGSPDRARPRHCVSASTRGGTSAGAPACCVGSGGAPR